MPALDLVQRAEFESVEQVLRGAQFSRILVIYTGGTIGMKDFGKGYEPVANLFGQEIRNVSIFHDSNLFPEKLHRPEQPLVMPLSKKNRHVVYLIYEYETLIDSTEASSDDWVKIAKDVADCYILFDGFIILHGTDTLAYTSSALSFMLHDLGKCVIVTGSQIPFYEVRSDGRDSFLHSLVIAGHYSIPEVTVYFDKKLYRGNRVTKLHTEAFDAFKCLNFPPLATTGVIVNVHWSSIFTPVRVRPFRLKSTLSKDVAILRLFPSITNATFRSILSPPVRGVVLQSYGAGNMPLRDGFLEVLKDAVQHEILILNISQCPKGSVMPAYEGGVAMLNAGIIPGGDMTVEAALTKLSYVIAQDKWSYKTKQEKLKSNFCGEITEEFGMERQKLASLEMTRKMAQALDLTSYTAAADVINQFLPSLMCSAAKAADMNTLKKLASIEGAFQVCDYDSRTALHVAASEGNTEVIQYLLENGALVHSLDFYSNTALECAVSSKNRSSIELLMKAGAHLSNTGRLGNTLCNLAAADNIDLLQAYLWAGADMNATDYDGRSALHIASRHGNAAVVELLLNNEFSRGDPDLLDMQGITPRQDAERYYPEILAFFPPLQ